MKFQTLSVFLLFSVISFAQKVELPNAKFMTGDNIAYSYPSWEDYKWQDIKVNKTWDSQGFASYDGFAWYRFHLVMVPSLKERSLWKDSIRIFLAKIDDACEVFINGVKIGKSGSFPDDKDGYITTWSKKQEFHIAANSNFFNWGGENILSVRVYDGGGPGGIYGGTPYANMIDLIDGVEINNSSPVPFISPVNAKKTIILLNTYDQSITAKLFFNIIDL